MSSLRQTGLARGVGHAQRRTSSVFVLDPPLSDGVLSYSTASCRYKNAGCGNWPSDGGCELG